MKNLLIAVIALMFTTSLSAQNKLEQKKGEMKIKKTAFISEALNLSNKKSEVFWPIYNKYQEEIHDITTSIRKATFDIKKTYESSLEEELETKLGVLQSLNEKEFKTKTDYNTSLGKILTAKERAILFMTESNFKREQRKQFAKTKEKSTEEGK
jgi:hypothetical protein